MASLTFLLNSGIIKNASPQSMAQQMPSVYVSIDPASNYEFKVDFNNQNYTFTRTHLEVDRLYSHLRQLHPEFIIPAYPPMSNDRTLSCRLLSTFLNRILESPTLASSPTVQDFLTSQFQFCPDSPTPPRSSKGFLESIMGSNKVQDVDFYFQECLCQLNPRS